MNKISLTGFLLFVFTALFSSPTLAQVKTKAVIKLPTFMAGNSQVVDKPVNGDLMISGKQIRITSNVSGDVYVAGGEVEISSTIGGNLIAAGGTITISGKINKNIIMAGGQIKVDGPAEVGGYVLAGGGKIDLLGNFSGPVKVGAGNLIVGEKAIINGNLEADVSKSDISSTSKITGEKKIKIHEVKEVKKPEKQFNQWQQLGYIKDIFSFLSKLVVLLIFVKLFGQKIRQVGAKESFWSSIGMGLVALMVTPVVALILMVTLIAIPLSMIVLGFYFVCVYLSGVVTSVLVGELISKKGYLKTNNHYLLGFVGLFILTLIGLIPVVGGLVKFVVLLFGVGIISKALQTQFSTK